MVICMRDAGTSAIARGAPVRVPAVSTGGALAIACGLGVVALSALRIADAPPIVRTVGGLLLLAAFILLTAIDYRNAVAVAVVELVAGGAAGGWAVFPGGVSGRVAILVVLTVGAVIILARDSLANRRPTLGRYGVHAAVLAVAFPVVWIGLALLNGMPLSAAVQDGNGYAAISLVLVVVALMVRGEGAWFRDWMFLASAFNAIFTFGLVILAIVGAVPLFPQLRAMLLDGPTGLGFGGAIGYLPTGAGRLWLASGLYLQVGLVLTTARLLRTPSRWTWLLFGVLLVDVAASYTRGFWIAAAAGVAAVVAFGYVDRYRVAKLASAVVVTGLVATVMGWAVGGSVPDYLLQRASSTTAVGQAPRPSPGTANPSSTTTPSPASHPPAATSAPPAGSPPPAVDELGAESNAIKVVQARVLLAEIASSPILGHGFGATAPGYPYGNGFVYELTYLDIGYKTGLLGLVLFLSFPLRLMADALRGRFRGLRMPDGLGSRDAAVPLALVGSVLIASATNPYLLAAYGILPIAAAVAWLDPIDRASRDV